MPRGSMLAKANPLMLEGWPLPTEFLSQLLAYHHRVSYEKGSLVFVRGAPSDLLMLVFDGVVRVYASQPDGGQRTYRLVGPGDFFGFVGLNDGERRVQGFDACALTKCSVAVFTRRHLVQVLRSLTSAELIKLIAHMNLAWSRDLRRQLTLLELSFRERLIVMLRELSAKFGVPANDGIIIDLKLVHGDLAEMVGCSRPIIGRLLAEMQSAGVIEITRTGKILFRQSFSAGSRSHKGSQRKDER